MSLSIGIGLGVTRRGGGAAAWTPASLPGFVVSLLPIVSRQQGKLWQNTAKTVAATADGDPVRVAVCPYTGREFVAPSDAARPLLWDEGDGKWSLYFDGIDDQLVCTLAASEIQPLTHYATYRDVVGSDNTNLVDGASQRNNVNLRLNIAGFAAAIWAGSTFINGPIALTGSRWIKALFSGAGSKLWSDNSLQVTGDPGGSGLDRVVMYTNQPAGGTSYTEGRLVGYALAAADTSGDANADTYFGSL